jgi:hypothetical protein
MRWYASVLLACGLLLAIGNLMTQMKISIVAKAISLNKYEVRFENTILFLGTHLVFQNALLHFLRKCIPMFGNVWQAIRANLGRAQRART